jgi:hypothetical protein
MVQMQVWHDSPQRKALLEGGSGSGVSHTARVYVVEGVI